MSGQHDDHDPAADAFAQSRARFEQLLDFAGGQAAGDLPHAALEEELEGRGRELLRQLLQDHLDLRAAREARLARVTDADGTDHRIIEADHERVLATVFGDVTVRRLAYRARGATNLHPADAVLNLPVEKHSHGLRRRAATEAARGSYDEALTAVRAPTGTLLGKRQLQALTMRAAVDFESFYSSCRRPRPATPTSCWCCRSTARGS